jgi:hypothetical protein
MMDKIMRTIWQVCRWIWVVIIIAIAVSFMSAVLAGQPRDFFASTFGNVVDWLINSHTPASVLILIACYLFLGLSAISGIYRMAYGKNDQQVSQQHAEALLQEMKTLTHMYANNMRQLHDGLASMFELHEHNLTIISNSLQTTSDSLKKLEQQTLLAPLEQLSQKSTRQDQQINALTRKIEQESQQLQEQLIQQKAQQDQRIDALTRKIEQGSQQIQKRG